MALENAITYQGYRTLVDKLLVDNKTTGEDHSPDMIHYTELNVARMNKWDKHFTLKGETQDKLHQLKTDEIWLVITEGWCGDAAHSVPVINALAEASDKVELKIVLRDENPDLMDLYLTNGSRSIPILIRLKKDTLEELGVWGPRPAELQKFAIESKRSGVPKAYYNKDVQLKYSRDRGVAIEQEVVSQLETGSEG